MNPLYLTMLIVGCVAIGAVCGPAIHTAFAEAKVKVEAKYSAQITAVTTELSAVKAKAAADIAAVKADAVADYNAIKARAETAESDLAAFKRFLRDAGTPAVPVAVATYSPVSIPPAPAPAQPPAAPDNTGQAATGTTGAFGSS